MKSLQALTVLGCLAFAATAAAQTSGKNGISFGTVDPVDAKLLQQQAESWLNAAVKDNGKKQQFFAIWNKADRPIMDKVVGTLLLDPKAEQLLIDASNPLTSAPTKVPALLQDAKQPSFFRANLALAYAKALSNRRIYEEALATLKLIKTEEVADPSAYLFHRAVAEHAMLQKADAQRSLSKLLDDVVDAPERYKTVGALMLLDMLTWKEKDLNWIARKMDNSGRRLNLARGGPVTQKIQKDIVNRLDEIIKELENKQKQQGGSGANGGGCPDGGKPSSGSAGGQGGQPMQESKIANRTGSGTVVNKKIKQVAQKWGSMPEKERRRILADLTKGMSDKHAQAIQTYFKKLSSADKVKKGKN